MFPEKHVRVSEKSRTCFFRIIRSGTKAYMNLYNKPPLSSDLKMNVWMRF